MASFTLIRRPEVQDRTSLSKTAIYDRIHQGTFPPPVPIGSNSVAWATDEIDYIIAAMIAGKSEDDLREIVTALKARRSRIFHDMEVIMGSQDA